MKVANLFWEIVPNSDADKLIVYLKFKFEWYSIFHLATLRLIQRRQVLLGTE